jgi:predicted DNA binding CopG/RHH family protein
LDGIHSSHRHCPVFNISGWYAKDFRQAAERLLRQQAERRTLTTLKPSLRTISVRLPVSMIKDLKVLANKRDVPYQSLLKMFLAERLDQERRRA